VRRIAPTNLLDPVVREKKEIKRRRKQIPPIKICWMNSKQRGWHVARGTVADEDRGPTDSPSGSEGDDKESSPGKGKLKNDKDYNSDTNMKKGDDDNATESKDEAEIKVTRTQMAVRSKRR
jgi:hypothetical protein